MAQVPYGFRTDLYNPTDLSYAPNELPIVTQCPALPTSPQLERTDGYYWIPSHTYSGVPSHAVRGGTDQDGSEIFVGRAMFNGDWLPAKIVPSRNQAYVAFDSAEHCIDSYEILCEQRFEWQQCSGGYVPVNAVVGGVTRDGERLYIGRTYHEGSQTVGKVHPSHACLYIPFDGQELKFEEYEILVRM